MKNISGTSPIVQLDQKRLEFAKETIQQYGDKISQQTQENILEQRIVLGMSPYEAYMAGGAFAFKVQADPSKWPGNANPYHVMWAQTTRPDNSRIWMTFETTTQFPEKENTRFRVFFEQGKAIEIVELTTDGGPHERG